MKTTYERPSGADAALRLHLNENTAGCSAEVIDAIRRVGPQEVARYPDYDAIERECARLLRVQPDQLLLTNGLDEGILAFSIAGICGGGGGDAIIVEPAFDMYAACSRAVGAHVVRIPPAADFGFPLDDILRSITDRTRLIFLTNPSNPAGQTVSRDRVRLLLRHVGAEARVFLDEAYIDFGGETLLDEIDQHGGLVIGRTFAKAYGLAGLRIGCLVGRADTLAPIRLVVPPYSVNVFAVAGLRAALADRRQVEWYCSQVTESRRLLYEACRRLRLDWWPSAANFVLVRVGDPVSDFVRRMAKGGVAVRDRSALSGCAGCVRITTGVVEDTKTCIALMEEILCDAR